MSFRTFLFIPAVIGSKDTVKGKPFRKGIALRAFSFYSVAQSLAILPATVHPYLCFGRPAINPYPYLKMMAFF